MTKRLCAWKDCKTDISKRHYNALYCKPCVVERDRERRSKPKAALHRAISVREEFQYRENTNTACQYKTGYEAGEITICGKSVSGADYCEEHYEATSPFGVSAGFHKSYINGKAPSGRSL